MPIDFTKPNVNQSHAVDYSSSIKDAITALSQMLDPAVAGTVTSAPTGAYRINGVNLERFNGTAWATYALNINGSAAQVGGVGLSANTGNNGGTWPHVANVKADGVMEVGFAIDFHATSNDGVDSAVRLRVSGGNLQSGTNNILHAGNYNTFSPTLTGTGASGSWPISVTGSAGSVAWTSVTGRPTAVSSFTNDAGYITSVTTVAGLAPASSAVAPGANQLVRTDASSNTYTGYINANHAASEVTTPAQFIVGNGTDNFYRRSSASQAAVAIRGAATGSWGISITGNAATATSVAWTGVTGRPTALSSFTNDTNFMSNAAIASSFSTTNIGAVRNLLVLAAGYVTSTATSYRPGDTISSTLLRAAATDIAGWNFQADTSALGGYVAGASTAMPATDMPAGQTWMFLTVGRKPLQGTALVDNGDGGTIATSTYALFRALLVRVS